MAIYSKIWIMMNMEFLLLVGNSMFNVQINNRLKDIKGSSLPFGVGSIVAVGDLFQLQLVMDGYIFKDMDNDEYGVLATDI